MSLSFSDIHFYLGDRRTLGRLFSLARGTWMTSANQQSHHGSQTLELRTYNPRTNEQRIFETHSYEPRTNGTRPYAVRKYTRMKYGPVFILGVVGGNSSANSTWDHFRIYGMLERKVYGQKRLSCCLLYKDGHVILQSDTMSQRWHEIPAPMWNFHASCSNVMHAQGKQRSTNDSLF